MLFVFRFINRLAHIFVVAGAFTLAGGDDEIVTVNGECGGIPVGGDETERSLNNRAGGISVSRINCLEHAGDIKYSHGIYRSIRNKKVLTACRLGQCNWIAARESTRWRFGCKRCN